MHAIRIDRNRPLAEEPHLGHNRYHPDIAPVAEVGKVKRSRWKRATRSTARSNRA